MRLTVVQSDLRQVCDTLRWITDGAVCRTLQSKVDEAGAALRNGDRHRFTASLKAFLAELEAQHGDGKPVSNNAYWLLKVNGEFLVGHE